MAELLPGTHRDPHLIHALIRPSACELRKVVEEQNMQTSRSTNRNRLMIEEFAVFVSHSSSVEFLSHMLC